MIVELTEEQAIGIIEAVGGEREVIFVGEPGQWVFPDDFRTWATDEAAQYAIDALPTIVFDAMGR